MSKRIAIPAAALMGLVAMTPPAFPAAAAQVSACALVFGTKFVAKRDDRASVSAIRAETLRPLPMPCDLGDAGCMGADRTDLTGAGE